MVVGVSPLCARTGEWILLLLSKIVILTPIFPHSPDELVVACNGSPLVIGISDTATYIASETSAFNRHTKEFISMKVRFRKN